MSDIETMGPIDYIVLEWPPGSPPDGSGLPLILDLVDRGIVHVLDLAFIQKDLDGNVAGIDIAEVGFTGDFDVTLFAEAASGLVGEDDIAETGAILEPGACAALLVYENLWAAPFAVAMRKAGAQLVASGRIPVQSLIAAMEQE